MRTIKFFKFGIVLIIAILIFFSLIAYQQRALALTCSIGGILFPSPGIGGSSNFGDCLPLLPIFNTPISPISGGGAVAGGGSANNSARTSSPSPSIPLPTPSVSLSASPNPTYVGQPVVLNASVSGSGNNYLTYDFYCNQNDHTPNGRVLNTTQINVQDPNSCVYTTSGPVTAVVEVMINDQSYSGFTQVVVLPVPVISNNQNQNNQNSGNNGGAGGAGGGGSGGSGNAPRQAGQILTFQATPSIINKGQSSNLAWTTSGFTSCSLTGNPPPPSSASVSLNDTSYKVTPATSTVYTLTCNPGNVSQSVQVRVSTLKEILPP